MLKLHSTKLFILFLGACFYSTASVRAEPLKLVPLINLQFSGWNGDNPGASNRYKSEAGMTAVGLMLQQDNWFGGLLLKSGQFDFTGESPVKHDGTMIASASIERVESDLVVGYYFWEQVALFADFKSSTSNWLDDNYSVTNTGVGLGVSGFYRLTRGQLYASFAAASLIAEAASQQVGKGVGTSTEFGWVTGVSKDVIFKIGLKSQQQVIDYDIAGEQTNQIGGIVIGISIPVSL